MVSDEMKHQLSKRVMPLAKTLCPFVLMAILFRVDTTANNNQAYIYAYYILATILVVSFWAFIALLAKKNQDKQTVEIQPRYKSEYKFKKRPKNEKTIQTVAEYDASQCWTKLGGAVFNSFLSGLIFSQSGYFLPLLLAPTVAILDLFDTPLTKIYVRGLNASDHPELKRPFKTSIFPSFDELKEKRRQQDIARIAQERAERQKQPAGSSTEEIVDKAELERRERKKAKRLAAKSN